jgi:hypothetical protein
MGKNKKVDIWVKVKERMKKRIIIYYFKVKEGGSK